MPICQHKRGGFCLKHGGGAKKHEKIIFKDIVGPDGKMKKKKSKKVFYVCDVAQNGSKLKQPTLQFKKEIRNSINSEGGTYSSTEGQSLISSAGESDGCPMKRIKE